MKYLYGKVKDNFIKQYLQTNQKSLESDWIELALDFLDSRPSNLHEYNVITNTWENTSVRSQETEWDVVKHTRNQLLQESDWTQLPDVPLSAKESWALYRQQLRDITTQPDPFNITWPTAPA